MILTLYNIRYELMNDNPIKMRRVYGSNKINRYELLEDISFELSNGHVITIPKGYVWDLSSVPRFLWSIFSPDGDFQVAALIHDYLYENNLYGRKFADKEMLLWSNAASGTKRKSFRNFDNKCRFYAVRLFGWYVWYQ